MDIEFSEYEVFQQALTTGILSRVKQLAFELHVAKMFWFGPQLFRSAYLMLLELERQGFRKFRSDLNKHSAYRNYRTGVSPGGCCFEMYYINLKFLKS